MKVLKALLAVFTFLAAALTCALLFVQENMLPVISRSIPASTTEPPIKQQQPPCSEKLHGGCFILYAYRRTISSFSASTVRLLPEARVPSMIFSAAGSSTALRMTRRRSRAPNLPPWL